jgi:cofilin
MIYAGTKDTIKKTLQGLQVEIQGTDKSEVDYNEVLAKCQSVSK